jgi:short-subunit dehydrogenase
LISSFINSKIITKKEREMDKNEKQVILITGASAGMGKETALQLISEGYLVYGSARRIDKMQDLISAGGHAIQMDVTGHESIVSGIKQILDEQGRIDVLWNNAGYGEYGAVEDVPLADARHQFEVNIFGLADLTKEVLPIMRKQKSGLIINTSSMGGKMYTPLGAWYHATKHALEGWSDCLRIEVKQFGIKVVVLEPGAIKTEWGGIMAETMMKHSGSGPYSNIANAVKRFGEESYEKPNAASPSSVISKTIFRIIKARNPKTRYVVGKFAKPMMFIRKWFGDRIFDKVLLSMLK